MERRAIFPVLFCNRHQLEDKPFLHASMRRQIPTTDHMTIIPYFSVNMQEAAIRVEYVFIEKLVDLILNTIQAVKTEDNDLESLYRGIEVKQESSEYVYFNKLELHPIKIDFTFRYNRGAKVSAALLALRAIGFAANIDDAPIKLNALILERPFLTWDELLNRIKIHYIRCGTSEVYKVLGSLEVIGNPVGLFNDLTTGVADFFYEPAIAITKGPEEFGYGLAKGSKSLVSKTFHGTFNTVSKVTGTLQRGLDYLTFDSDHIKQKERKQAPQGLGEGLLRGGEAVLTGIFDGASGIFTQPVKGAKKEGGFGFVKGIGKGLIGIPMKPVGGLFEGVTSVTAGISTTSSLGGQPNTRMRYPRRFGDDGALVPFDMDQSLAYDILITADNGKYSNIEGLDEPVASMINHDKVHVYVLTHRTLFKISVAGRQTQWKFDLVQLERLSRDPRTGYISCEFASLDMFKRNSIVAKELRADVTSCNHFVKKLQECATKAKCK
jgi:vacuolar protein sorting-associated protein 13A/C